MKYSECRQLLIEDYLRENRVELEGSVEVQSVSTMPSNEEDGARVGSDLLEQILDRGNLNEAFRRVRDNKGAAGIDDMTVDKLQEYLTLHAGDLKASLLNGSYKPKPVRRVEIPKPDGGIRLLGVPTVVDRVVQQAVAQVLSPIYEQVFSDCSYGFRPGRSAKQAVERCRGYVNAGYTWVVDIDLAKFFDTVNHDKLMRLISGKVADGRVISLIRKFLVSGVMTNGVVMATEEGTPQGGNISPLLSNIMLHELDKELEKRGLKFCRYADDCNIYVKSEKAAKRVMKSITHFLEDGLKLTVNQEKSSVCRPQQLKFLGFSFFFSKKRNEWRLTIHKKPIKRFKAKLQELTSRNWGVSMQHRLLKLKQAIQGWVNYFRIADMQPIANTLDRWLRRRIRMGIWRQWKRVRTRYKMLKKLGVPEKEAWPWANTRKGDWRIAKSQILQTTLTNHYLISTLGLTTLTDTLLKH